MKDSFWPPTPEASDLGANPPRKWGGWKLRLALSLGAGLSFQLAWLGGWAALALLLWLACLWELRRAPSARSAFWWGTLAGAGVFVPPMGFLWEVFGIEVAGWHLSLVAPLLWLILSAFHGLWVLGVHFAGQRHGPVAAALAAPLLWGGLEYFRSEVWWLKFAWFTPGIALDAWPELLRGAGVYGAGILVVAAGVTLPTVWRLGWTGRNPLTVVWAVALALALWLGPRAEPVGGTRELEVAGVQLETPALPDVIQGLDAARQRFPNAQLFVLGEYTLSHPPAEAVRRWCRQHRRWVLLGGTEPVAAGASGSGPAWGGSSSEPFRNTAFVLGPDGSVVFQQAKSVPIQFFQDGLPALGQSVWESPWGRLGIAICYDASYRRVMDRLVRQGAEGLLVIAMDAESWGRREHAENARMSRVRAREYGLPVFRVATSGISQCLDAEGRILAQAGYPGPGELLGGTLQLAGPGRIPPDAWLGPGSVVGSLALMAWLAFAPGPRQDAVRAVPKDLMLS
jgi:apolipoprotein N-acyltransferase